MSSRTSLRCNSQGLTRLGDRPDRRIHDDARRVVAIALPVGRPIRAMERMCKALSRLPVAGREAPDVSVEKVGREVHPGANPRVLGREQRGVAGRRWVVVRALTRGTARGMAAGEDAKTFRMHWGAPVEPDVR
jgi:hypothetical protein